MSHFIYLLTYVVHFIIFLKLKSVCPMFLILQGMVTRKGDMLFGEIT